MIGRKSSQNRQKRRPSWSGTAASLDRARDENNPGHLYRGLGGFGGAGGSGGAPLSISIQGSIPWAVEEMYAFQDASALTGLRAVD